jgi:hypothetical protein
LNETATLKVAVFLDVAELEKADYFELYGNVLEELGQTEEAKVQIKRVEKILSTNRDEESFEI